MQIAPRLARREQRLSRGSPIRGADDAALIRDSHQQSLAVIQLADKYRELKLEAGSGSRQFWKQ